MKIAKKIFTLICDDIRFEADNRLSLMGLIDNHISFDRFPSVLPTLSIMISLEDLLTEISEIEVIVKAPRTGPEKLLFTAPAEAKNDDDARLLVRLSPFRAKAEGEVKIQIKTPEMKKALTIHTFLLIKDNPLD